MKKILTILFLLTYWVNVFSQQNIIYSTVNTGTIAFTQMNQNIQLIQEAAVAVSLTITFPSSPFNGQVVTINSTGGITSLTLSSASSILNALTTMVTGGCAGYTYLSATNKWYRTQ